MIPVFFAILLPEIAPANCRSKQQTFAEKRNCLVQLNKPALLKVQRTAIGYSAESQFSRAAESLTRFSFTPNFGKGRKQETVPGLLPKPALPIRKKAVISHCFLSVFILPYKTISQIPL